MPLICDPVHGPPPLAASWCNASQFLGLAFDEKLHLFARSSLFTCPIDSKLVCVSFQSLKLRHTCMTSTPLVQGSSHQLASSTPHLGLSPT
ncbi:hypothetical protein E4T42_04300 [Aureobasidium subglaciale]|nr:hypothetical protein E4T38_05929 [Aureobasidium subglaciale]KAI5220609.1 hypothetical protein E4T40_05860 [Aureobasidium subglaciale]KAI5224301.1 hypothetical protein E4T41_05790 [Aureobasidium subglaciale]KAI5251402.1 hypothetical protein E4T42_04300 [Aureobasidium subglaciale]KAI5260782.1 hypothetical protein E4T46_05735 [Aureobasidium subglaciale]